MTFSWKELVCIGISKKIQDYDIINYLMKIVTRERRNYIDNESIMFHKSLKYDLNLHKKSNDSIHFIKIYNEMYIDLLLDCLSGKLLANDADNKNWVPRKATLSEKIFISKYFTSNIIQSFKDENLLQHDSLDSIILNVRKSYDNDILKDIVCEKYSKIHTAFPIGYEIFVNVYI